MLMGMAVLCGIICPLLVLGAAARDRWQRTQIAARQKLHELSEQLRRERQARSRLFVNLSAAVERQREDLLMELHDGVCGSLARALLALDRAVAGGGDAQGLGAAVASVRTGLAEARGLLGTLGAAASWDELVARLRWEAVAACERAGVTLALTTDGAPPAMVAPETAQALRRIAGEAITNALRHGAPTAVRIVLGVGDRELRLRVENDGPGGATVIAGHGLTNVRRRARRLGGDARFAARPGGGFVLEAWVQASHPSDVAVPVSSLEQSLRRARAKRTA